MDFTILRSQGCHFGIIDRRKNKKKYKAIPATGRGGP
jgi:hypothetical protein